jgi:predicted Kef-type K+ transport protein
VPPQFRLPPLLGMLLSGMILQNAAPGVVAPLPKEWSKGFRAVALGTIFLRSGFELDLEVSVPV